MAGLTLDSAELTNTNGGAIGAPASPPSTGQDSTGSATAALASSGASILSSTGEAMANAGASTASIQVPEAPGTVTAAGTIRNDGGRIQAGGAITLKTPQIDNAGGTLHVAAMAVSGANFSNAGGTLDVDRAFVAKVGRFDNAGGKLNAGSLDIAASGDLLNAGGTLASGGDANLAVGGRIDNAHGTVSATGRLIARASQEVNNSNGTLIANQGLTLDAGALNNTNGSIQSVNEQAQLDVVRRLNNTRGAIGAGTDLLVKAQALSTSGTVRAGNDMTMSVVDALVNDGDITAGRHAALAAGSLTSGRTGVIGAGVQADGTLGNAGDLRMTSTGVLIAHGTQLAAGTAMLQGASIELAVGQTRAAGIALTATQGNVSASEKAAVVTPGTLRVTADAQTAQALTNDGGMLHAGQLALNVSNLVNTNLGEIVHTGIDATRIAVSGTLKNDGGRIASNGQDLELNAAALGNAGGTLEHSGTGTLHIAGGSYSGEHGRIAGNGALLFDVANSLTQDNGQIRAREINIEAGALSNRGGTISGNTLAIDTRGGALDNSAKGTMAAADALTLRTGALNNAAGLIQSGGALRIDTNGQVLTNTDAAGYKTRSEDFAGGIASGGSLTLKTGDLKNTAGAIGSQGALTADTQAFTNTGGGLVLGQAKVHVTARGAAYDNSGGQTLAAGDFVLDAGASKVANDGGLIRSNAAALLTAGSVVNTNTNSDTNTTAGQQGIEGRNVTIVSGAEVDNTAGRMLALETLAISDPNVADPAARTLVITNTGGVLMGGQPPAPGEDGKMRPGVGGVRLAAKSFSGDGRIVSASGLGIALVRDVTHDADLVVDGDLSYTTGGKFTNNAKLMAGQTLTVGAGSVENAANAEMSGRKTVVNAIATLVNRGLIDSQGATQVDAGDVKNIGTGRIYGNAVSLAAGALDNREETVDGVTRAGTIAARETLNIGAGTVSNREHALIFSAGTGPKAMSIGGRLDENRQATTGGGVLDNLSARIESLGGMTISMAQINNLDTHVKLGAPVTTKEFSRTIGVEGIGHFKPEDVVFSAGKPNLSIRSPGGNWRPANGHVWGLWDTTTAVTTDVAIDADPAAIVAGRDMTLEGVGLNRDSRITAGDTLTAPGVKNEALQGQRATHKGSIVLWRASHREPDVNNPVSIVSVDVGAFEKTGNLNAIKGYDSGRAPHGASVGNQSNVIVEVPAAVGAVVKHRGQAADAVADLGNTAGTGTSQPMPMVVRTSAPRIGIPQASLFNLNGGPRGYLVETDPRFASYRKWLGSDYLLNGLGLDPNTVLKRLGDGFYEQKLVREQVAQLTGYRYLGGHSDDEAQYTALMNDGATFARQYGLRPGIALTAAQMAQLTSDIVWLVEQTVTLPDGSTQNVLAPQLYVRVRPGDIDGSGALLSAEATVIEGGGDITNTGTIAGRALVKIDKDNVNNLGGRFAGANVDIHARNDINNVGGRITADDSAVLKADRDINIEMTTRTQGGALASRTNIDRVAGVYVGNPGGTLVVNAGNDVSLIGGVLANMGKDSYTSVKAGKGINVGSVIESSSLLSIASPTSMHGDAYSREVGSTINGNGTVLLNAEGADINVRASAIDAGPGVLGLTAAGDINIFAGEETRSTMDRRQTRKKQKLKSTTTATASDETSTTSIGSRLSGGSVGVFAEGDINVVGSDIEARKNAALKAKDRVNILSSTDTASTSLDITRTTKGFIVPKLGGPSIDRQLGVEQHAAASSQTQRASTITAGENLDVTGDQQVNVFASHLSAGADLSVTGGKVTVLSGTNELNTEVGTKTAKKSIGTMGNPKRSGKGMNGKSDVTDSVYESTLAPATLKGRNVTLTAVDGDLTLGAAQIRAGGQVALSAPNGRVNMAVVKTARQVSQSRGESDPMYQRTRDTGTYAETANYTRIDSATLTLDTSKLNVELGQNTVKGSSGATVAQQTLEQVLATQRDQPGRGWLGQVQNDPALGKLEINWQGVPLEQRRWAQKQGSLTQAGGAVVAIVAAVLSWGAASGLGAAAGGAVGGGTAGTIVSAAVAAGISSIASQGAVSLINNNGDVGKVVKDLTSSEGIKSIVTAMAMATAGALQGLNIGLGIENYTATNIGRTLADGTTVGWTQVLQRNLINGVSGGLIQSAIQGTSVEAGIKSGLLNGLLNTAASRSAQWIGSNGPDGQQNLNRLASEVAHAVAGCLVGAGRTATGGGEMSGGAGCSAGALGAVVGHVTGQIYNPTGDQEYAERTIKLGQMVSGIAGALVGGTQGAADIASVAGVNAIENNLFGVASRGLKMVAELCAKRPNLCVAGGGAVVLQGQLERATQEIQRLNPGLRRSVAQDMAFNDVVVGPLASSLAPSAVTLFASTPQVDTSPPGFGGGVKPIFVDNTGNSESIPKYDKNEEIEIVDPRWNEIIAGGGFGSGALPSQSLLTYSAPPPSILDANGRLPPGIGGVGTPMPMSPSPDPDQTAEEFARQAFGGQQPFSVQSIGRGWLAKLPDGTAVLYRPAGQATKTEPSTATVEINNSGVRLINNGQHAKFKFPKK
jgi:filamentous hemagglutinin